ncbi:MAG: hypothetical protein V2I62_01995 [Bacteroidales bacterium]|jgi:hypothetical protein|nr:hypothetical protein [Bacteroidales bacterium]
MKKGTYILLLFLIVQNLHCQDKTASGIVFDNLNFLLIQDAKIQVENNDRIEYSNEKGRFDIQVPNEHNRLLISKEGYKSKKLRLKNDFQERMFKVGLKPLNRSDSSGLSNATSEKIYLFDPFKNALSLSAIELFVGAIAIRYERFTKSKSTMGVHSSFYIVGRNPTTIGSEHDYYMRYQGIKLNPFYRFYIVNSERIGLFAEGKITVGYIHFSKLDYHYGQSSHMYKQIEYDFWSAGYGLSLGIALKASKPKRFLLNISVGYQYFPIDVPETMQVQTQVNTFTYRTETDWWYKGGPGSKLDIKLTIGRIF